MKRKCRGGLVGSGRASDHIPGTSPDILFQCKTRLFGYVVSTSSQALLLRGEGSGLRTNIYKSFSIVSSMSFGLKSTSSLVNLTTFKPFCLICNSLSRS